MAQSWSGIRKRLEQDLLCEKLRGRVQYFVTLYHGAPDDYGRFAVRVDGEEVVRANPYTQLEIYIYQQDEKKNLGIPDREWTDKGEILFDEENLAAEKRGSIYAAEDGIIDSFEIPRLIDKFLSQPIDNSLEDEHPIIRMLAILDRRVGKRRLEKIAEIIHEQPEWLQPIYRLRLDAEGIRSEFDKPGMKRVILSHDGPGEVYLVPDVVADNLEKYCLEFCNKWLPHDKNARKYRTKGGICYGAEDFIDYLNKYIFPEKPSVYVETIDSSFEGEPPERYQDMKWFNF